MERELSRTPARICSRSVQMSGCAPSDLQLVTTHSLLHHHEDCVLTGSPSSQRATHDNLLPPLGTPSPQPIHTKGGGSSTAVNVARQRTQLWRSALARSCRQRRATSMRRRLRWQPPSRTLRNRIVPVLQQLLRAMCMAVEQPDRTCARQVGGPGPTVMITCAQPQCSSYHRGRPSTSSRLRLTYRLASLPLHLTFSPGHTLSTLHLDYGVTSPASHRVATPMRHAAQRALHKSASELWTSNVAAQTCPRPRFKYALTHTLSPEPSRRRNRHAPGHPRRRDDFP